MPETLAILITEPPTGAGHMRMRSLRHIQRRDQIELEDRIDEPRAGSPPHWHAAIRQHC